MLIFRQNYAIMILRLIYNFIDIGKTDLLLFTGTELNPSIINNAKPSMARGAKQFVNVDLSFLCSVSAFIIFCFLCYF